MNILHVCPAVVHAGSLDAAGVEHEIEVVVSTPIVAWAPEREQRA